MGQQRADLSVSASESTEGWVRLCDAQGRIQARYHPGLLLLIIQDRGKKTIHDLKHHSHEQWLKVTQQPA